MPVLNPTPPSIPNTWQALNVLSGTQPFGIQPGSRLTTGSMIDELVMFRPHGVLLNGARWGPGAAEGVCAAHLCMHAPPPVGP